MNDQVKGILQSVTFWGVTVSIFGAFFPTLALTDTETASIVQGIVTVIGTVIAIYGRVTAVTPIAGLWKSQK